jgi:hypothetical protein
MSETLIIWFRDVDHLRARAAVVTPPKSVAERWSPRTRRVGTVRSPTASAARAARAAHRGLWGACKAAWNPDSAATTSPKTHGGGSNSGACDPSYPDVCIPAPPPDLDCADVPYMHFRVAGADPHHVDGDRDGFGCER